MMDDEASTRRRRRLKRVAQLLMALGLLASPWWGPHAMRPLSFFRVRHIEVRGARLASPAEVVQTMQVDTLWSVWDRTDSLVARVKRLAQVESAEISRRLPGTLVVTITEYLPVALIPAADGFRAYDEDGRALALDMSRMPMDLPVIQKRDTTLLRLLGEVRASDPSLFARVSELRRAAPGELVMQLVTYPVRLRADAPIERLELLAPVEQDLVRRKIRVAELDLRFNDQVIARLP